MISPRPRTRPPAPTRLTIPEIREELERCADTLDMIVHPSVQRVAARIRELSEETKRRTAIRRAPTRHTRLTEEDRMMIREYVIAHPREHLQSVAVRFNTNAGRVSEAIHGKRTEQP